MRLWGIEDQSIQWIALLVNVKRFAVFIFTFLADTSIQRYSLSLHAFPGKRTHDFGVTSTGIHNLISFTRRLFFLYPANEKIAFQLMLY